MLSFLFASTTATAAGKTSPVSWWSVIIVSIPKEFAYAISSTPEIPQSTVIIKFTPFCFISSKALLFKP